MNWLKIFQYAEQVRPRIEREIEKYLGDVEHEKLRQAMFHLIKAGGKRLRPIILLLSTKALGGDEEKAYPAAAAIEIFHNFTLIHDDIMDRDEMRRGVPTVHVVFGEPLAILAGDLMHSITFGALVDSGVDDATARKIVKRMVWSSKELCVGQAMDMEFEQRERVTEAEYIEMVKKKTGALIAASSAIGALIAGKGEYEMLNYGLNLGIAFQIRDDLLSLIGDEKVTGKPRFNDLREGKKTLPVIKALEMGIKEVEEVLGKNVEKEKYEKALQKMIEAGIIDYAQRKAEEYARKAIEWLERAGASGEAKEMLIELAEYSVKREK